MTTGFTGDNEDVTSIAIHTNNKIIAAGRVANGADLLYAVARYLGGS